MGLTFDATDGLVPEYEVREAAIFSGNNWQQWLDLTWQDRAAIVAHYRVHNIVEAHVQDAADQERRRLERATQRRQRRQRR